MFTKLFKSKVIKHFFIYSFGSVAQKAVYLFAAPIIMRILSPADYGLLSLTNSFINIVVTLVGLGLRQFLSIEYFHVDSQGKKSMINDILSVYLIVMIPFFLLLFLNVKAIDTYIFVNHQCSTLVIIGLIICFFKFFTELFYQLLQYNGIALKVVAIQVCAELFMVSFALILLYVFGFGVTGIFIAQLATLLLVFLLALFVYFSVSYYVSLCSFFHFKKTFWYIKKGLPFVPRFLFAWFLAVGDRWILATYSTMTNVGIYSVADTFGQVFQLMIIMPVIYAYIPYLLKKFAADKENVCSIEKWNQKNMFLSMIVLFFLVTIGYIVLKPIIQIILPSTYQAAIRYVWLLLVGYIFLLGTHIASTFIHFKKKVYFLVLALCIPAILNIMLNIFLIPQFQIWGCVFATVISYIVYFIVTIIYNYYLQRG